ncbi:hypothetical protein [Alkalimarinus coralli]|uniref:hypothetical protein n=1 Tax=Alkalimarinus coralli TaxID=2935863 RepID=UPI00202B967D|nr:hypothetical protein [Alkalimarinus coralli]
MIVFEGNMKKEQHKIINELFLRSAIDSGKKVNLWCHSSSSMNQFSSKVAAINHILVLDPGGVRNLFKPLLEMLFVVCASIVLLFERNKQERTILFLSLSPVSTYLITCVAKLFSTIKYILVHHGELEFVSPGRTGMLSPGFWVDRSLKCASKAPVHRIVLGRHIKSELNRRYPGCDERVSVIEHPIDFIPTERQQKSGHKTLITFGVVGELAKPGIQANIAELVTQLSALGERDHFECIFMGRGTPLIESLFEGLPESSIVNGEGISKEFIPSDKYSSQLDKIDCFLVLYPSGEYQLTASGVFAEMASRNKKYISLHNGYFSAINSSFPDSGYLVNDVSEMVIKMQSLASVGEEATYDTCALEEAFSQKNVARQLKALL